MRMFPLAKTPDLHADSDYRGLKKRITAIRKAQLGVNVSEDDSSVHSVPVPGTPRPSTSGSNIPEDTPPTPGTTSQNSIKLETTEVAEEPEARSTAVRKPILREKKSFRSKLPSLKLTKNSRRKLFQLMMWTYWRTP